MSKKLLFQGFCIKKDRKELENLSAFKILSYLYQRLFKLGHDFPTGGKAHDLFGNSVGLGFCPF